MTSAISEKLLPANRALHDFLQKEYLPRARTGIALSELPLGRQWYAFLVKRATSSALSPDEIGRIGIAEVERHRPPTGAQSRRPLPAGGLVNAYKELAGTSSGCAARVHFPRCPRRDLDIRGTRSGCRNRPRRCTINAAGRPEHRLPFCM